MNIVECYKLLLGDYNEVLSRLPSERSVRKFLLRFLEDKSYEDFLKARERGDLASEFRAVHTLKGISLNLGIMRLYESSSRLTEFLRGKESVDEWEHAELASTLQDDYEYTCTVITMLD